MAATLSLAGVASYAAPCIVRETTPTRRIAISLWSIDWSYPRFLTSEAPPSARRRPVNGRRGSPHRYILLTARRHWPRHRILTRSRTRSTPVLRAAICATDTRASRFDHFLWMCTVSTLASSHSRRGRLWSIALRERIGPVFSSHYSIAPSVFTETTYSMTTC